MNQTVTVTTKNTASLTLGIISLILGVMGLLVGWVPFLGIIGVPAAIIGGFLGVLGIIFAVIKGFKGLVMPILGSCICLLAFVLPIVSTGYATKSIDEAMERAAERAAETKSNQSMEAENTQQEITEETVIEPEPAQEEESVGLPVIEKPSESEEAKYIKEHLEVYEVSSKYVDTFMEEHVPSVSFKIKNKGDKSLDTVQIVFYFLDSAGNRIAEKEFLPVHVSSFSLGDNKPLKAGYVWGQEKGKVYTAKSVPSEWQEGAVEFEISEIKFTQEAQ